MESVVSEPRVMGFLRERTLADLMTEHGVRARVDGHKMSLNYDQIAARDDDALAQECRGLVLGRASGEPIGDGPLTDLMVLARPFDRFFNLGQGAAAQVDVAQSIVWEKVDGTLAIVYFDDIAARWCVATRAVCEADVPLGGWTHHTFRTLFEETLTAYGFEWASWTRRLDSPTTYIFELCTPVNRVVVAHEKPTLWTLGARERNGDEWLPAAVSPTGIPKCPSHDLRSIDDVMALVRDRDPARHEGVVLAQRVAPHRFARVKVKSAGYLALSRIKDVTASPRGVLTLILGGSLDDALEVMTPDARARAIEMADGVRRFVHETDAAYAALRATAGDGDERERRKAFAMAAKGHRAFDVLMAVYAGKAPDAAGYFEGKRDARGEYPSGVLDSLLERIA